MPSKLLSVTTGSLLLGAVLWIAAWAPLATYNALAPGDAGAAIAAADIAYGPHARQTLDVYVPSARSSQAQVVVVFYGGSWNSGSKRDYSFLGKALSSRGFVTIIADYRLVPEVRFPTFLEDSAAVVAWARANAARFNGDADQLYLLGHSAGAYNAAMIALDERYLRAAGAAPSDIRGVIGLAGPYDFLPLAVDSTQQAFGQAKDLATTQPINFVSRSAPPMMLATGDADTTVKPRNTLSLASRLLEAGAQVIVRQYPGVGHVGILLALSRPLRSSAPVLDDIDGFIKGRR